MAKDNGLNHLPIWGSRVAAPPAATRAALYVRVSTQAQADKWSLPSQRKLLAELAVKRGWDAILYDEGGVSAETVSGRPVMKRLLDDVAAGRIDLVAVVEMERLCRASDLRDWATISTTFREAGVPVATPERIFNLETAEDDFEADLRGILSKREKRKLLERTKRGLDAAKDAGKFAGGRPMLGYTFDHATRKIVPDPQTVPLVQRIFESDLSAWQLHGQLKGEGIHVWYQTIRRIRSHPFYLGKRKNTRGELIEADWPAIVDEELWKKWQRRPTQLARRSPRPRGSVYLLSALVRCRDCGGPVVGRPTQPAKDGTPLFAYRCHEGTKCTGGGGKISGRSVDAMVMQALTAYVKNPDALRARYRKAVMDGDSPDIVASRALVHAEAQDLDDRESRLMDAVERGVIPDAAAQRRMKRIEASRQLLRTREESLLVAEGAATLPSLEMIVSLAGRMDDGNRDTVRKLLEMLARSILLSPRQRLLSIRWRLGGEVDHPVPVTRGGQGSSPNRMRDRVARGARTTRLGTADPRGGDPPPSATEVSDGRAEV